MTSHPSATTAAAPDTGAVRAVVTQFLARYVDDVSLLDAEHLLTGGILDSLAAVELIAHLERRFGFTVVDEDLEVENFDSVAAITAFVQRKLGT